MGYSFFAANKNRINEPRLTTKVFAVYSADTAMTVNSRKDKTGFSNRMKHRLEANQKKFFAIEVLLRS
jgi:hypothetical protein